MRSVRDEIIRQKNDYKAMNRVEPNAVILGETAHRQLLDECSSVCEITLSALPSMTIFIDRDNENRVEVFGLKMYRVGKAATKEVTCDEIYR